MSSGRLACSHRPGGSGPLCLRRSQPRTSPRLPATRKSCKDGRRSFPRRPCRSPETWRPASALQGSSLSPYFSFCPCNPGARTRSQSHHEDSNLVPGLSSREHLRCAKVPLVQPSRALGPSCPRRAAPPSCGTASTGSCRYSRPSLVSLRARRRPADHPLCRRALEAPRSRGGPCEGPSRCGAPCRRKVAGTLPALASRLFSRATGSGLWQPEGDASHPTVSTQPAVPRCRCPPPPRGGVLSGALPLLLPRHGLGRCCCYSSRTHPRYHPKVTPVRNATAKITCCS